MVGKMAQYDAVAEKLCQVEYFSIIAGNKVLCGQDLTFNQPIRTQLPIFLRHLPLFTFWLLAGKHVNTLN